MWTQRDSWLHILEESRQHTACVMRDYSHGCLPDHSLVRCQSQTATGAADLKQTCLSLTLLGPEIKFLGSDLGVKVPFQK